MAGRASALAPCSPHENRLNKPSQGARTEAGASRRLRTREDPKTLEAGG